MTERWQELALAGLLDGLGVAADALGTAFGQPVAAMGAKAFLSSGARALRDRGVSTRQLIDHLEKLGPLKEPWNEGG